MADFDTLVVGGGFTGCMIASRLGARGQRVLLVEKQADLLTRASFANPARLGLAFPQSIEAGFRNRVALVRFAREFRSCIAAEHPTFYALGRSMPKLTAGQFHLFCRQIGTPVEPAPEVIRRLFDPAHIETVFRVEEATFDAVRLRACLRERLEQAGVEVALETSAEQVQGRADGSLEVLLSSGVVRVRQAFNCAYSHLNTLLDRSGLPMLPVRYELAELALVEAPGPLRQAGLTILSGPCFSLVPFPSTPHHSLSHVRFAAHSSWSELGRGAPTPDVALAQVAKQTGFDRMRREASRYMPTLGDLRYQRSLWEVKTAALDGEHVLFRAHAGCRNLHCVLGTRIEAIYDILDRIDPLLPRAAPVAA